MEELKNRPEIRFKGFEEEWKNMSFESTFSFLPNNTLSRAELNYQSGLAKSIHYGDVLIKFGEILDAENINIPFITNDKISNKLQISKLNNGDIVFADTAEDNTVGKCTELINANNSVIYSGLHTIPVRPSFDFASGYLGYYLNSSSYHNQLLKLIQGIKVSSISKSSIKGTSVQYPDSLTEQSQIGTFFQHFDTLITRHQQKHTKLLTFKKAMLEKMFPKAGADVPEIRFKGFDGKWEEKKLIEVAKYRNGRAHENDIDEKGIYIVVNSKFVSTDGAVVKKTFKQSEPLYKNEIAFVLSDVPNGRAIARTYIIRTNNKYSLNQRIAGITPFENTHPYFLHILMNRNKYFLQFDDGAKQTNLSKSDVEQFETYYPCFNEQVQIGNFFQQLENLIASQKIQIEKLQNLKQALLNKMFV